jgi:hypothetical protein
MLIAVITNVRLLFDRHLYNDRTVVIDLPGRRVATPGVVSAWGVPNPPVRF